MFPPGSMDEAQRDRRWMKLAAAHDPLLKIHSLLVAELCASFAAFLGWPEADQRKIERAGLLHDIGKLSIPSSILKKSSDLTTEEWRAVENLTELGYEMLLRAGETDPILLRATRDHHERLDGSGYPRKLLAEDISLHVRVITLCDVFAAMTEQRAYATAMSWKDALHRMAGKKTRLDLALFSEFHTMVTDTMESKERFSKFGHRLLRTR